MSTEGLIDRLRRFVRRDHAWPEFWSAAVAIAWGAESALDHQVLAAIGPYGPVVRIVPEGLLEMIAILVGCVQVWSLIFEQPVVRGLAAAAASWLFSMFVWSFLASDTWPPGWPFACGWVGINVFAFGRWLRGLR